MHRVRAIVIMVATSAGLWWIVLHLPMQVRDEARKYGA